MVFPIYAVRSRLSLHTWLQLLTHVLQRLIPGDLTRRPSALRPRTLHSHSHWAPAPAAAPAPGRRAALNSLQLVMRGRLLHCAIFIFSPYRSILFYYSYAWERRLLVTTVPIKLSKSSGSWNVLWRGGEGKREGREGKGREGGWFMTSALYSTSGARFSHEPHARQAAITRR